MRYALYDTKEKKVVGMVGPAKRVFSAGESALGRDAEFIMDNLGQRDFEHYRHPISPMHDDTLQRAIDTGRAVLEAPGSDAEVDPEEAPEVDSDDQGKTWFVRVPIRAIPAPEPELTKEEKRDLNYLIAKIFANKDLLERVLKEKHND